MTAALPTDAQPRPQAVGCAHRLGKLPCINPKPHPGHGHGCIHDAGDVPDRHRDA